MCHGAQTSMMIVNCFSYKHESWWEVHVLKYLLCSDKYQYCNIKTFIIKRFTSVYSLKFFWFKINVKNQTPLDKPSLCCMVRYGPFMLGDILSVNEFVQSCLCSHVYDCNSCKYVPFKEKNLKQLLWFILSWCIFFPSSI